MKKDTKIYREKIVNQTYYYIYKNLNTFITLDDLAKYNSVSKYHFHRIFKEESKYTVFEEITSIRLQKAANLLITNKTSTISLIANSCGFSSHSSFIKAFKKKFIYSPKQWRKDKYKEFSKNLIKTFPSMRDFSNLLPIIKPCRKILCSYIRHKGYTKDIKFIWEKLNAIAYENNIREYKQIAIYHDNPAIIDLKNCSYLACIEISEKLTNSLINLELEKSLCAVFSFKGVYGDILSFIRYVYHIWLPSSGYEAKTVPAYSIFHKNHFSHDLQEFDLDFYLPISVIY